MRFDRSRDEMSSSRRTSLVGESDQTSFFLPIHSGVLLSGEDFAENLKRNRITHHYTGVPPYLLQARQFA
jgi:hypothetical protein